MSTAEKVASSIGKGLVAGVVGTAAMTVSSTLEARLRGRASSSAPARATAKVLGISSFEDGVAQARFNDLSHWGYGTSWGSAQVTLPALDIAPPSIFWGSQEVAIDAFHHTVYALATGVAYELLSTRNGQPS